MKAAMISIPPKWCELIASGKKSIEVRKTRPKIDTPFKCYIYCTKGKSNDRTLYINPPSVRTNLGVTDYWSHNDKIATVKTGTPFGYIACRASGNVIGEFVCDNIKVYESEFYDDNTYECIKEKYEPIDYDEYGEFEYKTVAQNGEDNYFCRTACLTWNKLRNYIGQGINNFYGWHISDLVIYDKPKELSEFNGYCDKKQECFLDYVRHCDDTHLDCKCKVIKRPPQSWQYVEELK